MLINYNTLFYSCSFFLDEIVKRKLLVDGDGGGDDKRLVLLQKYVIDWCNETSDNETERLVFYFTLTILSHNNLWHLSA